MAAASCSSSVRGSSGSRMAVPPCCWLWSEKPVSRGKPRMTPYALISGVDASPPTPLSPRLAPLRMVQSIYRRASGRYAAPPSRNASPSSSGCVRWSETLRQRNAGECVRASATARGRGCVSSGWGRVQPTDGPSGRRRRDHVAGACRSNVRSSPVRPRSLSDSPKKTISPRRSCTRRRNGARAGRALPHRGQVSDHIVGGDLDGSRCVNRDARSTSTASRSRRRRATGAQRARQRRNRQSDRGRCYGSPRERASGDAARGALTPRARAHRGAAACTREYERA